MSELRQQVNLYQPTARAAGGMPFSGAAAGLLAAGVTACLALIWAWGSWHVRGLEKSVEVLRRQQEQQSQTISALGAARASGLSGEQLQARVQALSAELAVHSQALLLMRSGALGQTRGFSGQLTALARSTVEGVWIDHLELSGTSISMSVAGAALDPNLVPRYLHELAAEQALAGMHFDRFVIERPGAAHASAKSGAGTRADETPSAYHFHAESDLPSATATDKSS